MDSVRLERLPLPPCDRGPNPISPIITTVHHDSARRQNPYGILPMMQSTEDQRDLHNDQKPAENHTNIFSCHEVHISSWPMIFQRLANFCWQPWIPLVKCKCITPGWQVAIVRVHNVSVRNSGIEVGITAVKTATDRIPEICIWNSSTQISANRQISSPRECHIWRRVKCITEGNCNEYMMECNPPNPTSIQYWDLLLATIVIMSVWTDKQC